MELNGLFGDLYGRLSRISLRHGNEMTFHSPVVEKPGCLLVEISTSFDLGGHFCNLELGDLERGERLSKLLPGSNMLNRLFHGSLGKPYRFGGDVETGMIKESHELIKSFPGCY
jgi:hypothetical protein